MRRVLFIVSLFMLVCGCLEARTIIVEVGNVRGNQGNILVMAQAGKDTKPVYGMAKSEKGKVTIRLENVDWEKFDLSVFHDENGNMQMDMLEGKGPAEGYAMKSCEAKEADATFRLKLYYPVNE
ncbi:DUF2141 domain-containing protein [Parabacteroides sp.]